jgi:hypothetical protein
LNSRLAPRTTDGLRPRLDATTHGVGRFVIEREVSAGRGPQRDLIVAVGLVTAGLVTAGLVTAGLVTAGLVTLCNVTAPNVTAPNVTAPNVTAPNVAAPNVTACRATQGDIAAVVLQRRRSEPRDTALGSLRLCSVGLRDVELRHAVRL